MKKARFTLKRQHWWAGAKSQGIRMYRSDKLDELATPTEPYRNDKLRELVDKLPADQRHVVSRKFFGGAPIGVIADELGIDERQAKALQQKALTALKLKL